VIASFIIYLTSFTSDYDFDLERLIQTPNRTTTTISNPRLIIIVKFPGAVGGGILMGVGVGLGTRVGFFTGFTSIDGVGVVCA
jgi:hypothetical protein